MLAEATELLQNDTAFLSKESHTVYQEVEDDSYPSCHPRNLLQQSSKRIVDFARLNSHSVRGVIQQWRIFGLICFLLNTIPLRFYLSFKLTTIQSFQSDVSEETPVRLARREFCRLSLTRPQCVQPLKELYARPDLLALVQAIASPEKELYRSACPYNAAYYNMYTEGDGLGWHFDRGEFGYASARAVSLSSSPSLFLSLSQAHTPARGVSVRVCHERGFSRWRTHARAYS